MNALSISTRSRLDRVLYIRDTPRGTPYAVGMATDSEGRRHTVLAAGEEIDPDHFRLLEGQDLALRVSENGVRVRPIAEQPPDVQNHLIAMLQRGARHMASAAPIPHAGSGAGIWPAGGSGCFRSTTSGLVTSSTCSSCSSALRIAGPCSGLWSAPKARTARCLPFYEPQAQGVLRDPLAGGEV
jgi:hypothetical protein